MSAIEGTPPPPDVPKIWGDYNAFGLSHEPDDNCLYSLHREELAKLEPEEGEMLFVYENDVDDEGRPEVFGYVCTLEKVDWAHGGWRARPDEATWYRGPKTWQQQDDEERD